MWFQVTKKSKWFTSAVIKERLTLMQWGGAIRNLEQLCKSGAVFGIIGVVIPEK